MSPDDAAIEREFKLVRTEWQFPASYNVAPTDANHADAIIAKFRSENGEHDISWDPIVSPAADLQGECSMPPDTDYVLGTHNEEIARLGLQHQVWRPHMLDAWARAGMTRGSRVVDFGAGPGYATCDAAEIVGSLGHVTAIERSPHFLEFALHELKRRNLSWVNILESDLMADSINLIGFDIAWCRWVASFVRSPSRLLKHIAASLRVGGRAVMHEYLDYSTWRMIPNSPSLVEFVTNVMVSWRDAGGEPNIVAQLLPLMADEGLTVVSLKPLIFAAKPADFVWQWPASFAVSNSERLVQMGLMQRADADRLQNDFRESANNPSAVMMTPLVLEVIAEKQ